jgi:hypothetical protein
MTFNLPPFWSPKYAYTDGVRVEDLQRGTFTTRQQPRGSYDDPWVSSQGYLVPNYVMQTPYGQGAVVTKWMPRGTAPYVAHWFQTPRAKIVAQTKASGDGNNYHIEQGNPSQDPMRKYGRQVADHVIRSIRKLPKQHRRNAMKQLFDRIDPRLFTRVHATASKARAAGIPAPRALHHAIATEFRSGMARELTQLGQTGRVRTASQVGLGCFGCVAIGLGDDASTSTGSWRRRLASEPPSIANACGYVWIGSQPPPAGALSPGGCPPVRKDHPVYTGPSGPQIPLPYCGTKDRNGQPILPCNPNVPAGFGKLIAIGPFAFDSTGADHRYRWTDPKQISQAVHDYLQSKIDPHMTGGAGSASNDDFNPFHLWLGYSGYAVDGDYYSTDENKFPMQPLVKMQHPYLDKPYGMYLFIRGKDPHADASGETPPVMSVVWASTDSAPKGLWGEFVSGISSAISGGQGAVDTVKGWVQDGANAIGDAVCGMLNQPGAAAAAAASGPAAGVGAAIAKGLCGGGGQPSGGGPPVAPTVTPQGSHLVTFLLLGGVGVAAYLLTK